MNYREALEFIGEVRAGISWERFCIHAVRHSDVFIDILNDSEGARKFLSSMGISGEYISGQITKILYRLHFNRDDNHYLTLALSGGASEAQIRKRWKELMLLYHPDRNRDEQAASCAARINEAYNVLKNQGKRMEYERKRVGAHQLWPVAGKFRTPPARDYIIVSPKLRSALSKLIIPACVVIAGVILLVIFLENRQRPHVYYSAVSDEMDGQQQSPVKEKEEARVREQVKAEGEGKEEVHEKGEVKAQERVKTHVQEQVKEAVQVQTGREPKAFVPALRDKSAGETRVANDGEVSAGRFSEEPREMPGGKVVNPAPAQQAVNVPKPQDVLRTEPEKIDRSVNLFISQYARAYEEADIEKFMSFFSRSAVENGRMNYDEIRRAYKQNFEKSRYRYRLKNVRYRQNGDDVVVSASYRINKSVDNRKDVLIEGDIRWTLAREEGALRITRVDYEGR